MDRGIKVRAVLSACREDDFPSTVAPDVVATGAGGRVEDVSIEKRNLCCVNP